MYLLKNQHLLLSKYILKQGDNLRKKRLLFVSSNLNLGGVQKSLVSLLSNINLENYEVDLLLLKNEGIWIDNLPKSINVLKSPEYFKYAFLYKKHTSKNILYLLSNLKIVILLQYLFSIFTGVMGRDMGIARQHFWVKVQKCFPDFPGNYDVAIAYSGGLSSYIVADKIKAKKKVLWIHTDYRVLKRDIELDRIYYRGFNHVVAVSNSCRDIFVDIFPEFESRTKVIHNIVSPKAINELAISESGFNDKFNGIRIISIGRLDPNKGYELAINACSKLVNDGYNIKWYLFGEGPERENLENLIKNLLLMDKFILMGTYPNPYPFILQANIFVHPSKFEGKSVAIDEAKALCKPIVVTNYTTVGDQIEDGKDGMVVPISEDGIYQGLKRILDNQTLREQLSLNLKNIDQGNLSEILKFYSLIDDTNEF